MNFEVVRAASSSLDASLKAATGVTLHSVLQTLSVAVKAGHSMRSAVYRFLG